MRLRVVALSRRFGRWIDVRSLGGIDRLRASTGCVVQVSEVFADCRGHRRSVPPGVASMSAGIGRD